MTYIVLDTSDRLSYFGIFSQNGDTLTEHRVEDGKRSTGWISELIFGSLNKSCIERSDIKRIACGLGPGGFTSIRVAVSICKGFAQGLNAQVVGFNRLEAAATGTAILRQKPGTYRVILPASKSLSYTAVYKTSIDGTIFEIQKPESIHISQEMTNEEYFTAESNTDTLFTGMKAVALQRLKNDNGVSPEELHPLYIRTPNIGRPSKGVHGI